ncbi:MAG TPA: polysaccharide deacetylase family protein [Candidatus Polarisedimenticolaceae bacterium]|nr:polysaccharide deacetylase family protein [Candidatus Polarisedimenticolaceae bacterium]
MMTGAWSDEWGPWGPPVPSRAKAEIKFLLASGVAAARSLVGGPRGVAILNYHGTPRDRGHLWWHDFAGQMSWLDDHDYRVVGLGDVVAHVSGAATLPPRTVALTFDDGWSNNLDVAFPLLHRRGWPATVFVPSAFLDRRPFMTRDELREVVAMGFEVGNHTHSHPDVSTLSGAALREEVRTCSSVLEDVLGVAPRYFCFPYGRYDPASRAIVAESGFAGACSGRCAFNRQGDDPFLLRRWLQEPGEGTRQLAVRMAGGYGFLDLRQRSMDNGRRT